LNIASSPRPACRERQERERERRFGLRRAPSRLAALAGAPRHSKPKFQNCEQHARQLGLELTFHQSNHEGELVDWIQSARQKADAIIINPAGYSFSSIAILDAIKAFEGPVLEVHISNIHARDEHHRHSKISTAATGVICGLGPYGYVAAMQAVVAMAKTA
jgi:3-dehydroquinate dehydratase-2